MTTSLAFRANIGVSVIDLPRTEPIDDPRASLQAAVHWHFGPDTGSRYWLNRAKTLEFNSLTEAMADKLQHHGLQHHGQDPSEIDNWTWDPPQSSANALIIAVCIPIDRNDHVCC